MIALVTGANTGIGKATAQALAADGNTVIVACRSEPRAREAIADIVGTTGNDRVEFLPLDLADLASVRRAAEQFLATDRPLDLLVNNAGVAGQRGLTTDGFELAFGINHVGHFLLTQLLTERLLASAPARIVTVSSGNHFAAKGIDWEAVRRPTRTFVGLHEYNVSKLANGLHAQQLAARLDPDRVTTFSVNPGPVASDVWRRLPGPLYRVFAAVRRMKSVDEGAQPTLYAATTDGIDDRNGSYVDQDCRWKEASAVATPALGRELWARSEQWVAAF